MTRTPETLRTVDAFFERFGAGDLPGLLELFADTVDFDVPGSPDVPWTGARSGRDEIAGFFTVLGTALTPPEEFTVTATVVDGVHAVVTGRSRFGVVATGKTFTNPFALHFTVVDGKITGYHMHEDSHAIAAAFAA
ncbi:nuclear transport factor 2 family protein [Streptomyces sp. NPDC090109]|uniref:nuclear transport factor 2 family protein n=1 Tax=unclassified Streptomyces TaxID=2593676 RepID=UPI000EF7F539|nr:nuclear transport factor 2 family protein [Streptomyces sp. S1]